jgi:hypothetical protein
VIGLAAQIASVHLAACGAECRCLGPLGDIAAARRTFHKTTYHARVLVRLAAQFAALDLAALGAKFDTALGLGLLATITTQQHTAKNHGH